MKDPKDLESNKGVILAITLIAFPLSAYISLSSNTDLIKCLKLALLDLEALAITNLLNSATPEVPDVSPTSK